MKPWTTPADLRAQVEQLWRQGRLLQWLLQEDGAFPLALPLRTPSSQECSERFDEVRSWAKALQEEDGRHWRLEMREWRHPVIGRNSLPQCAWIDDAERALGLIGRHAAAQSVLALARRTRERLPALLPWLHANPLRALELVDAWDRLLEVVAWLLAHPRPDLYLRQVDLPAIDSKFIEQQRAVLAELLDLVLPAAAVDSRASGVAAFSRRYGFRDKPVRIRLRVLDPACGPLAIPGCADISLDSETFGRLELPIARVFITENETNFLTLPKSPRSIVIFGAGYGLDVLGRTSWLGRQEIHYWGDIDTHGFAILDELRAHLPQARSLLMDQASLLAHRAHWSEEPKPTTRELTRLTTAERAVYDALRWHRLAPRPLRLEQERIGYGWVQSALAALDLGQRDGAALPDTGA